MATILFDWGSTFSYVYSKFALDLDKVCDMLDSPVYVSTPTGDNMVVTQIFCACTMMFMGFQT